MAKTKARKAGRRTSPKATPAGTAHTLRSAWDQAQHALASAQAEIEKQVKTALRRNKIGGRQADEVLKELGARFDKERRKAQANFEAQLGSLAGRVQKGGKAAGKRVGVAVEQALASLNIPSRREVADLTKKVEELSRKIDSLKRRK
jgi:hypothetical protein